MTNLFGYLFVFSTIAFGAYSQLIMRWQVGLAGPLPQGFLERLEFIGNLLINGWVISGIVATFCAGVSWMLVMTKFEISYAYPFVSLNYVVVFLGGIVLFQESVSVSKLFGTAVVVLGLIVIARS